MEFRTLRADEIDARVNTISEKGCSLLLYKDARVDMVILDETFGADHWQRKHYECKGNLFCSVGIKIGSEWIWKDDAGSESNTEKEKGEASDSFKRACVNWGIGRELYTAPRLIWIPAGKVLIEQLKGKYTTRDRFYVEKIAYNDKRQIIGVSIRREARKDRQDERVYVYSEAKS